MKSTSSFFIFIFLLVASLNAQQIDPLHNNISLTPQISGSSNDFAETIIQKRIAAGDTVADDEKEMLQILSYNFQHELRSGSILFSDSLSQYIRDIVAVLLRNDQETFSKLRFFVTKEARVNAYSMATGDIVVTIGMLAQVDNEAQLAYILAHEITHFKKKHSIKRLRNAEEKPDNSVSSDWKSYYNFSKENEFEADLEGLKLFRESPWSLREALRSFDVLEYSRFPFDDRPFDTTFFNRDYLKIPPGYFLHKVDPIFSDDNRNDSYSTHPNVRKRRMAIMTAIDTMKIDSGKLSVVAGNPFSSLREKARYELCLLHLRNQGYGAAIYSAYLLLLDHPEDDRLRLLIGQALYEVSAMYTNRSNSRSYNDNIFSIENFIEADPFTVDIDRISSRSRYYPESYTTKPGQQQQVYRLLSKLDNDEIAVLTLSYNWALHKKFPGNAEESRICDSLFSILVNEHNLHVSYFSHQSPDEALAALRADSLKRASEMKQTGETKYTRLEKFRLQSEKERFLKFAFVEQLKDSAFENRYRYFTDHRRIEKNETPSRSLRSYPDYSMSFEGKAVSKIIVVPVEYYRIHQPDRKKKKKSDPAGSIEGSALYDQMTLDAAAKSGVETVTFDPRQTSGFDAHALLRQWFDMRNPLGPEGYAFPIYDNKRIDSLVKATGTSHVLYSSVLCNYGRRIKHPGRFITLSVVFPPTLLYGLVHERQYKFQSVLMDVKTGKIEYLSTVTKHRKKESKATERYLNYFFKSITPKSAKNEKS